MLPLSLMFSSGRRTEMLALPFWELFIQVVNFPKFFWGAVTWEFC